MADSNLTLQQALAAVNALPTVGSARAGAGMPGVDFEALGRVRRLLPLVWSDVAVFERAEPTPQGGIALHWRRPGMEFDLTVDPMALYALRLVTRASTREWTRATLDQAVADSRAVVGLPPLQSGAAQADRAAAPSAGTPRP
jgi:hypothetical protein